jgi:predicted Ser/Thr protein kinase
MNSYQNEQAFRAMLLRVGIQEGSVNLTWTQQRPIVQAVRAFVIDFERCNAKDMAEIVRLLWLAKVSVVTLKCLLDYVYLILPMESVQ